MTKDGWVEFKCAICNIIQLDYLPIYPGHICPECSARAVDENGNKPWNNSWKDEGSDPIFIDGVKCWRRYRFGGYKDMLYTSWEELCKRCFPTICDLLGK